MRKIQIHTLSIRENIDEITISKWLAYVTPAQRERLLRYRFREDFLRSLAGEAMLRVMAGEKTKAAPEKLAVTVNSASPLVRSLSGPDAAKILFLHALTALRPLNAAEQLALRAATASLINAK